jgi:hypothetical protein
MAANQGYLYSTISDDHFRVRVLCDARCLTPTPARLAGVSLNRCRHAANLCSMKINAQRPFRIALLLSRDRQFSNIEGCLPNRKQHLTSPLGKCTTVAWVRVLLPMFPVAQIRIWIRAVVVVVARRSHLLNYSDVSGTFALENRAVSAVLCDASSVQVFCARLPIA